MAQPQPVWRSRHGPAAIVTAEFDGQVSSRSTSGGDLVASGVQGDQVGTARHDLVGPLLHGHGLGVGQRGLERADGVDLVRGGRRREPVLRVELAEAPRPPQLVEGFTKNTFTAMIEGVRESSLRAGLIDAATFDTGIESLYRTTENDGVFCYTFFKAVGRA